MIQKIKSSYYKKSTFKKILGMDQKNDGVINIHRYDVSNVGDLYCAPHQYFKELEGKYSDIFLYKRTDQKDRNQLVNDIVENSLIIGGGGLLNRGSFTNQMKFYEKLAQQGKKTVLWGIGHNEKKSSLYGKINSYDVDVTKFGMAGTRDYKMPGEWLPCVSCLHELFDNSYKTTQEIGVIFHKKTIQQPSITSKFKEYPSTSNTVDLEGLINFIGRSEYIITDSYHAMYWSMLLGKKVAVIPNSSKFYDFKYDPVFTDFDNALKQVKNATIKDGLLEECRELNRNFAKRAFEYLEV
ncbi:polysaccharide pyruvyl transferase family protein [Nonlabens ulvanivorans]|uniref:polysaccharide pyruvyl transferase family protein n=3 Tax=Nonlabens ulvanivorans TaxID=906888 RepID=UPI0032679832